MIKDNPSDKDIPEDIEGILGDQSRRKFLTKTLPALAIFIASLDIGCNEKEKKEPTGPTGPVVDPEKKLEELRKLPRFGETLPEPSCAEKMISDWDKAFRQNYLALAENSTGFNQNWFTDKRPGENLAEGWRNFGEYVQQIRLIFAKHGLPYELVYIVFNESNFNQSAVSHKKACGPFQFVPRTGRQYGLDVYTNIDERRDILLSAEAAAKYLKKLSTMFPCEKNPTDSFLWALAAYNMGEGNAQKYYRKCENHTFAEYYEMITKEYSQVTEYKKELKEEKNPKNIRKIAEKIYDDYWGKNREDNIKKMKENFEAGKDNMTKDKRIKNEKRIESAKNEQKQKKNIFISKPFTDLLKLLGERQSYVRERMNYVPKFFGIAKTLFGKDGIGRQEDLKPELEFDSVTLDYKQDELEITVKQGDILGEIANSHGVRVADLKKWNDLSSDTIKPGQKLKIYIYGAQIALGDLTSGMICPNNEILKLNPAVKVQSLEVIFPEGYELRLPKDSGARFIEIFKNNLEYSEITKYRKTDIGSIAKLTQKEKKLEEEKQSLADKMLAEALKNLEAEKAEKDQASAKLREIYAKFDEEAKQGIHSAEYSQAKQEIIAAIMTDIQEELDTENDAGANIEDGDNFIDSVKELYKKANKFDPYELAKIVRMYSEFLASGPQNGEKDKCYECLKAIQTDLQNILTKITTEIKQANYLESDQPIPVEKLDNFSTALAAAQEITEITGEKLTISVESLALLIESLKYRNQTLHHSIVKKEKNKIAPKEQKTSQPIIKPKDVLSNATKFGLRLIVQKGWNYTELGLCYGVSREDIEKANPEIKGTGLKHGREIILPVHYTHYKVQWGDTKSEIAEKFGISRRSLDNTNYNLSRRELRQGETLLIILKDKN